MKIMLMGTAGETVITKAAAPVTFVEDLPEEDQSAQVILVVCCYFPSFS